MEALQKGIGELEGREISRGPAAEDCPKGGKVLDQERAGFESSLNMENPWGRIPGGQLRLLKEKQAYDSTH